MISHNGTLEGEPVCSEFSDSDLLVRVRCDSDSGDRNIIPKLGCLFSSLGEISNNKRMYNLDRYRK